MSTPNREPIGTQRASGNRPLRDSLSNRPTTPSIPNRPKRNRPWGKLAIAASFLFSFSVIGYAFSKPFVSNVSQQARPDGAASSGDEFQATLTSAAYLEYARKLDHELSLDVAEKYQSDTHQMSETDRVNQWKKRMIRRKEQLDQMRQQSGQKRFQEGTLEWQTEQEFLKVLDDTPPGL